MKKLFLLLIGIALMMPCAAQDDGYVTMPDGSIRSVEQLMLSAVDMRTYLYSLSGAEKESVMSEIIGSFYIGVEQMNAMRGSSLYGDALFFDGIEFNEQTMEMIFNCTFNEEVNGQRYDLKDFVRDNNMDQTVAVFSEQFKQSFPPGYTSAYEWLKVKFILVLRGSLTNDVKRYSLPLY